MWDFPLGFGVFFWQHLHNSIQDMVGAVMLTHTAGGKDPTKKDPKPIKTQMLQRININDTPRATS